MHVQCECFCYFILTNSLTIELFQAITVQDKNQLIYIRHTATELMTNLRVSACNVMFLGIECSELEFICS